MTAGTLRNIRNCLYENWRTPERPSDRFSLRFDIFGPRANVREERRVSRIGRDFCDFTRIIIIIIVIIILRGESRGENLELRKMKLNYSRLGFGSARLVQTLETLSPSTRISRVRARSTRTSLRIYYYLIQSIVMSTRLLRCTSARTRHLLTAICTARAVV